MFLLPNREMLQNLFEAATKEPDNGHPAIDL
jgi:hypothetical protein